MTQPTTLLAKTERQGITSLAAIFAFRMLGLFMILPVFALYANELKYSTPTLMGIALGIYGLTQALLQIPLGMLSDRIGRKPVIAAGLLLFVCGSVIAAMSHTIYGVILGRALQGAGAVGSTVIALLSDLTKVENRTKAMAIIGMTIGLSFTLAMVIGPVLNTWFKLSGIFWATAILGSFGILLLYVRVPTPPRTIFHRDSEPIPALFKTVLKNKELLRLDFGILAQHAILTATFVAIPIALEKTAGLSANHQWFVYLPVLILAFIAMLPLIIIAEKKRRMKPIFLLAICGLFITQGALYLLHQSIITIATSLLIFFTAFSLLEASLPSLISKIAPAGSKGTAMGVYSSSQFFGIFLGGLVGGIVYSHYQLQGVFLFCALLAGLWFCIAAGMKKPPHLGTHLLSTGKLTENQARLLSQKLQTVKGVFEAAIMIDDGIAYLKVDNTIVDKGMLTKIVGLQRSDDG